MRSFQLTLSDEIAAEAKAAAERLGTSVEEFLTRAVVKEMCEAADDAAFDRYGARFDEARIDDVPARIPDAPPVPGDEIEGKGS
jgi:hypothetical protein